MSAADLLVQGSHFPFCKNWLNYATMIDELKIAQRMADLQRLAGCEWLVWIAIAQELSRHTCHTVDEDQVERVLAKI